MYFIISPFFLFPTLIPVHFGKPCRNCPEQAQPTSLLSQGTSLHTWVAVTVFLGTKCSAYCFSRCKWGPWTGMSDTGPGHGDALVQQPLCRLLTPVDEKSLWDQPFSIDSLFFAPILTCCQGTWAVPQFSHTVWTDGCSYFLSNSTYPSLCSLQIFIMVPCSLSPVQT